MAGPPLAGLAIPLPAPGLSLALEYVSGRNALGAGSAEILRRFSRHWRVDPGAPVPGAGEPE
jgi:hypothetical protein